MTSLQFWPSSSYSPKKAVPLSAHAIILPVTLKTPENCLLGTLLLTWVYFNPSMDKQAHAWLSVVEMIYPPPNFNGAAVEV